MAHGLFVNNEQEAAFSFKSAFQYSRVAGCEADMNEDKTGESKGSTVARTVMISLVYASFAMTFPISAWFCIKKIKALERCIIFRLGKRLPLKGPGLVVTFPCIDVVDTIDLNPSEYVVCENEQLLTSDGSVVEITRFAVTLSVANAVRSYTQLKDSRANIQQFIKLAFTNLITSAHVEDLERKIDWMMKDFFSDSNRDIEKWGWDMTMNTIPRIKVISRADPVNPLMNAIKGYFCPGDSSQENAESQLINLAGNIASHNSDNGDPFFTEMQTVAKKYCSLSMLGFDTVTLQAEVKGVAVYNYSFSTSTGELTKLPSGEFKAAQLKIVANSVEDIKDYIKNGESSRVEIINNLF
ncbi:Podocin [Halotydeus destructor]|nr:Podocin [Halotydeus destructor]